MITGSLTRTGYIFPAPDTDATTPSKVLFRRLETVSPTSNKEASLYESVLQKVNERKHAYENRKDQRESRAKSKVHGKQEQLLAAAKDQHEALAKRARFEQVWKSRRDVAKAWAEGAESDPTSELFHLYDVVRVDEESPDVLEKREKARRYDHFQKVVVNNINFFKRLMAHIHIEHSFVLSLIYYMTFLETC